MLRTFWLVLLAVLSFLGVLLARLPARWISAMLPANTVCSAAAGTLWHGECAALMLRGQTLGHFAWRLNSWSLWPLATSIELRLDGPVVRGSTIADLQRGDTVILHDLDATLTLPTALVSRLPSDLAGTLQGKLSVLRLQHGWIREIRGTVAATGLVTRGGPAPTPLGNFELSFAQPAASAQQTGSITGQLRDTGGPLDVRGQLTLTVQPGYLLQGTVAARSGATDALRQQLAALGPADAAGRRRFAQEAEL